MISEDFAAILAVKDCSTKLNTLTLFDVNHDDSDISPIDQFIENSLRLTKLWAIKGGEIEPEIGILLLLGYISAVESYMRSLIRRLIASDQFSHEICESLQVSFGAAIHHKPNVLPEALLEETVFSVKDEIPKALNKFTGIFLNNNKALAPLFTQYDIICQLRHCCVHRFGKLGAKNATIFGLQSHKQFLEKPVLLKNESLSSIADIIITLVKSINIEMFKQTLIRSATGRLKGQDKLGIGWTWHKTKDRKLFLRYYSVFACKNDAQQSPPADELYERFRKVHRKIGKNNPRRSV